MKKDLPAKGSEWVRLILSGLVFLAFIPATILALPKVMELFWGFRCCRWWWR